MSLETRREFEEQIPVEDVPLMKKSAACAGNISVRVLHGPGEGYQVNDALGSREVTVPEDEAIVELTGDGLIDAESMRILRNSLASLRDAREKGLRELESSYQMTSAALPPDHLEMR